MGLTAKYKWDVAQAGRRCEDLQGVDCVANELAVHLSLQTIPLLKAEGRRFLHDPRKRHCTLCSLTSFSFDDERLVSIGYSEPAGDLIPVADRNAPFSSGGADPDAQPPIGPPS